MQEKIVWSQGKKSICVDACPLRALDASPLDELRVKYGEIREVEGLFIQQRHSQLLSSSHKGTQVLMVTRYTRELSC